MISLSLDFYINKYAWLFFNIHTKSKLETVLLEFAEKTSNFGQGYVIFQDTHNPFFLTKIHF